MKTNTRLTLSNETLTEKMIIEAVEAAIAACRPSESFQIQIFDIEMDYLYVRLGIHHKNQKRFYMDVWNERVDFIQNEIAKTLSAEVEIDPCYQHVNEDGTLDYDFTYEDEEFDDYGRMITPEPEKVYTGIDPEKTKNNNFIMVAQNINIVPVMYISKTDILNEVKSLINEKNKYPDIEFYVNENRLYVCKNDDICTDIILHILYKSFNQNDPFPIDNCDFFKEIEKEMKNKYKIINFAIELKNSNNEHE